MLVVAGLNMKNLEPRVWDPESPYYLKGLKAVMVSYGDFIQMPARLRRVQEIGLRGFLKVPEEISIYLDNGAFYFARNQGEPRASDYRKFVRKAKPDWHPIRFDAIPAPKMSTRRQAVCYRRTMAMNYAYQADGYVPVVHAGRFLTKYIDAIERSERLTAKGRVALGALVPHLLRSPNAATYESIIDDLGIVRERFSKKEIHVFGIGGTATLHIAALLRFDSADSSGWRNRAARGIIQMPGSGERMVAELGSWRGRRPSEREWSELAECQCPACRKFGSAQLKSGGIEGFSHRATHNLWILLEEARWVDERISRGNYARCYQRRLDNTVYLPLIARLVKNLSAVSRRKLLQTQAK